MLQSLKHLAPDEAETVLASFAKTLLPTPEKPPTFPDPALAQRLLQELSQRAEIARVGNPAEVRGRVLSVLAQELSGYALQSANLDEIKARLGARGELRSDYYKIEIPPVIKELQKRGIQRNHIERALRQPSAVEHLSKNGFDQKDELLLSIFVKDIGSSSDARRFTLLVQTQRKGATQTILSAWRIYHSDIEWPAHATPLSILKSFVQVFGLSFKVGDGPLTKFVLYQRIPVPKDVERTNLISIQNPERHDLVAQQWLRIDSEGFAEVAIAYVIDMTTYGATLKRHGVTPKK
jgi:hypothetical protein